ncbi:MAG: type II secretion system F family protein, partial [Nitrospirae bacterium]
MPLFAYKASTRDGQIVEGVVEADNEKVAVDKLKDSGVIPLRITKPKPSREIKIFRSSPKRALLTFTTELSVMLKAGLPLDKSLNILSEISENKMMRKVIKDILKDIRGGSSLSGAMSKHKDVFPRLYVNMVKAGETGGVLENILERLSEFLETSSELKEHVYSSMIYPIILFITGSASIVILLTYVLPKFSVIFEDLGEALPTPT